MNLTLLEKKILFYVYKSKCSYLGSSLIRLIESGHLSGQSFKFLKNTIEEGNSKALELKLIEYFEKYKIDYPIKKKYLNKHRQEVYRTKNRIIGKKQLNFYVNEDLYNRLQLVKDDLNMTYSQLLEYLLKKD